MINIFNNNQPLLRYILIPVAIILLLPSFLSIEAYNFDFVLGEKINQTPMLVQHFFVLIILVFNANRLNALVVRFLKSKEKNYLASFFYLLLASSHVYWFGFSNFFMATLFLVPSLAYLMTINHQKSVLDLSFRAGFWLGLSMIFESSLLLLLIFYIWSLFASRNSSFREWFVMIVGVIIPFLFYFTLSLLFDKPFDIFNFQLGVSPMIEFFRSTSILSRIFVVSSLIVSKLSVMAFRANWNKAVHHDKISKKSFLHIASGLILLGAINSFDKTSDFWSVLFFVIAATIPSYFLLFKKEKIGRLLLYLYVYAVIFLLVFDYFY